METPTLICSRPATSGSWSKSPNPLSCTLTLRTRFRKPSRNTHNQMVLNENTIFFFHRYSFFGVKEKKKSVVSFLTAETDLLLRNNPFKPAWRTEKGEFFQKRLQLVTCPSKDRAGGWRRGGGWNVTFVGGSLPAKVQIRLRHCRFFQYALMFYRFLRVRF